MYQIVDNKPACLFRTFQSRWPCELLSPRLFNPDLYSPRPLSPECVD